MNRFKFKSKQEILNSLSLTNSFTDIRDSFLVNDIQELRDLDLTTGMRQLLKQLEPFCHSLETILFYKNEIESVLLVSMGILERSPNDDESSIILESSGVLESSENTTETQRDNKVVPNAIQLITSYCQDLQLDAYPFIWLVFPHLAGIIRNLPVESVQIYFEALQKLFKVFSKSLVTDYKRLLLSLEGLFEKDFQFLIAKTLAILTRKLNSFDEVFDTLRPTDASLVISEAFKVTGEFHSLSSKWIAMMVEKDYDLDTCETVFNILGHYGNPKNMHELFLHLYSLYPVLDEPKRKRLFLLNRALFLLNVWVGLRSGDRLQDKQQLLVFIRDNFALDYDWLRLLATSMLSCTNYELSILHSILRLLKTTEKSFVLYEFVLQGNPTLYWKSLFIDSLELALDLQNYKFIFRVINYGILVELIPHQYRSNSGLNISKQHTQSLLKAIDVCELKDLLCLVNVVMIFDIQPVYIMENLHKYLEIPCVEENFPIIGTVLECCAIRENQNLQKLYTTSIERYLKFGYQNVNILRGFNRLVSVMPKEHLKLKQLIEVYKILEFNCGSFNPDIRRFTFDILTKYEQPQVPPWSSITGPCHVLELLFEMEKVPNDAQNERKKQILMKRLEAIQQANTIPNLLKNVIGRYAIVMYSVNFRPLWANVSGIVIGASKVDGFWDLVEQFISRIESSDVSQNDDDDLIPKTALYNKKKKELNILVCTSREQQKLWWRDAFEFEGGPERYLQEVYKKLINPSLLNIDYSNCYCLLIKALGLIPQKVIKHSQYLMELFLKITGEDGETKNARLKILAFLECFSNVSVPSKLYQFELYEQAVLGLLTNGDTRLQEASFKCVIRFGYKGMDEFGETYKRITEDNTFRDTLATLCIQDIRDRVSEGDRMQLIDVLMRILWGKLSSRKGRNSKAIYGSRRLAIFSFISTMTPEEREPMITFILKPFAHLKAEVVGKELKLLDPGSFERNGPIVKQIGFLNVLEDFISQMQKLVADYLPKLFQVILHLLYGAEQHLNQDSHEIGLKLEQARQVRLLAVKRIIQLFNIETSFDFDLYVPLLFSTFINNRLDRLALENTQSTSALLELFFTWSRRSRFVKYMNYDSRLITGLLEIITAKKVQDTVLLYVISMLENIIECHSADPELQILPGVFESGLSLMLEKFEVILKNVSMNAPRSRSGTELADRIIVVISKISGFVTDVALANRLMNILLPFLKPAAKSTETRKIEILEVFKNFIPMLDSVLSNAKSQAAYYPVLCQLFLTLKLKHGRILLCRVFRQLSQYSQERFGMIVDLLEDLNSWSTKRLDEVDFDRLFGALADINQNLFNSLKADEWQPILYNLFYHMNCIDEFAVRSSASQGVLKFIERVKLELCGSDADKFTSMLLHLVFPQIKAGIQKSELPVREEFITILGKLVSIHSSFQQFSDMVCLLGDRNDEETNFFNNMVHVQVHRRIKAMKQLSEMARGNKLSGSNISNVFVAMISHHIFECDTSVDHVFINESISCLASLSSSLVWSGYYAMVRRFLNAFRSRVELQKVIIRLLVAILEEFRFEIAVVELKPDNSMVDRVDHSDNQSIECKNEKIRRAVIESLLPSFQQIISIENDEDLPNRVPLAIAMVKLIKKLPREAIYLQLPKVLLMIASYLTSHLQSSRDSTRHALVTISRMLGSDYLQFIIQSLTSSLKRGYQVHVLSYTLHAILEENLDNYDPGSIDGCSDMIVSICMGDIFGETSKEKEVQVLKAKMKEIRVSKSFESIQYLCRLISIGELNRILLPLKQQLFDSSGAPTVQKSQEIFRKIALGLISNAGIDLKQLMIFIHQLLTETMPLVQPDNSYYRREKLTVAEEHHQVQLKRESAVAKSLKHFESNAYLFVEFGLSLLHTCIKQEKISYCDSHHLELMNPMVSLLGKSLFAKNATTISKSLRIFNIIVKWPLPDLEETKPVLVARLFQLISRSASSESEMIQNVFRLLSVVLRDCKEIPVSERKLIILANLLKVELESSGNLTMLFSLIRGIVDRRVVAVEIYDLMDQVAELLATSQTEQVRQHCRQIYLQFLTNYPHGHVRLRNQVVKLISNLNYEYESGRASVLETLQLAVNKFNEELFVEYSDMMFLTVSMVLANDESAKCKEMAGILLKSHFKRLGLSSMKSVIIFVDKWLADDKIELKQLAFQIIAIVIETFKMESLEWANNWSFSILRALEVCLIEWKDAVSEAQELRHWEIGYFALKAVSKYVRYLFQIINKSEGIWIIIGELLLHPHQWVRLVTCRIFGAIFGQIGLECMEMKHPAHYLIDSEQKLFRLARPFCLQLDSNLLNEDLSLQIVKNLLFITKHLKFYAGTEAATNIDRKSDFGENELQKNIEPGNLILWLIRKLSHLARTDRKKNRGVLLRKYVFIYFSSAFQHIHDDKKESALVLMISALYHTEQDETFAGKDAVELKSVAKEVLLELQQSADPLIYVKSYQLVKNSVQIRRRSRKEQKITLAVTDPQLSAQAKLKKNSLKVAQRKRKIARYTEEKLRRGKIQRIN